MMDSPPVLAGASTAEVRAWGEPQNAGAPVTPSTGPSAEPPRPKAPSIPSVRDLGKDVRVAPLNAVTEVLGTPVPELPPAGPTKSITSPLNSLGLKPGSGAPLAPIRTPSPMAIVGGSLRINSPGKAMTPVPLPQRPSTSDAFAPTPSPLAPPAAASSSPLAFGGGPRPSTAPTAGATVRQSKPAYERAFRQWSSPAIEAPPADSGPVTFQVYTPADVANGRRPLRSLPAIDVAPKKQSVGKKIALALLGVIIIALTAAAVFAVSTEEPKKAVPVTTELPAPPPPPEPAPTPSVIVVGDGVDEGVPPTPSATVTAPAPAPKPVRRSGPHPSGSVPRDPSAMSASPSTLKGVAPPPNPYGKL